MASSRDFSRLSFHRAFHLQPRS